MTGRASMSIVAAVLASVVVACWSSSPRDVQPDPIVTPPPPLAPPSTIELRAVVRIDPTPSGAQPQGVWLELADGIRYVVDDRPRALWGGFADAEVVVRGHCYRPRTAAIRGPHFEIEHLKFAAAPAMSVPLFEIGPIRVVRGAFVEHAYPAGSKLAGTTTLQFRDEGGASFDVANPDDVTRRGDATVRARQLEPNRAYAATGGDPLWIVSVHDGEPEPGPAATPCP